MVRRVILAVCALLLVPTASAQADTIDEVIEFYDPSLASAKQAVTCHVYQHQSLNACLTQYGAQAAASDPDLQNIIAVVEAVRDNNYPLVLTRAGLAAACAWIDVPEEDVVCSDLGGAIAQAGAEALSASGSVASEVASTIAGLGGAAYHAVVCVFSSCSSGSGVHVSVDGAVAWNTCFAPRISDGVRARLGGAGAWARLTDTNINGGYFVEGSLQGDCSNALLGANSTLYRADIASLIAQAFAPMHAHYREIVEQAAVAALAEAAGDYHGRQAIWTARAGVRAANIFTLAEVELGPTMANERLACIEALDKEDAIALGRWASAGAGSNATAGTYTRANWNANSPNVWCMQTYNPALQAAVDARRTPYLQALAAGCSVVGEDRTILRCAALGAGMQSCRAAFNGMSGQHCRFIPLAFRVVPTTPPAAQADSPSLPDAVAPPPGSSETAPPPPPAEQRQRTSPLGVLRRPPT